jgi:geranylgeranyl diphosphate synthase type I
VGGGTRAQQESLFEYGRLIGLGFQIWDDVLDLRSDKATFGKPVLNDIRNGKKTVIVVDALEKLKGAQKKEFLAVLGKKDANEAELVRAKELLDAVGSIDHADRVANEFIAKAKDRLGVLKDSPHKDALRSLADYMVTRKT